MSKSLKQLINLNSEAVSQLSIDVSEAVDFHKNIVHEDATVADLSTRVTANKSLIEGLNTTTSEQTSDITQLQSDVSTNATGIQNMTTGFNTDIEALQTQVTTNEDARLVWQAASSLWQDESAQVIESNIAGNTALGLRVDGVDTAYKAADASIRSDFAAEDATIRSEFATADAALQTQVTTNESARLSWQAASSLWQYESAQIIESNIAGITSLGVRVDGKQDLVIDSTTLRLGSVQFKDSASAEVKELDYATIVGLESNIGSLDSGLSNIDASVTILNEGLAAEISRAQRHENILAADLSTERIRAEAAEGVLTNDLSSLAGKVCFTHMLESEGLLVAGEYFGSGGMGALSSAGFGIQIPFAYNLFGIGIQLVGADPDPGVTLQLEHYDFGVPTKDAQPIPDIVVDSSKFVSLVQSKVELQPGNLCVRIVNSAVTDIETKCRLCIYLQSV